MHGTLRTHARTRTYIHTLTYTHTDARTPEQVLTMDFVHGVKISDKKGIEREGMDPAAVARTVTRTFGDMTYCHG